MSFLRPIRGHAILVDRQFEPVGGIEVPETFWPDRLDFTVAAVGPDAGFGVGDTVVLADPNAGRKVRIDGVPYRIVRESDIQGVLE